MPNDICDSLLVWLGTFDAIDCTTFLAEELTDGLVLSSVLNQVLKSAFCLSPGKLNNEFELILTTQNK